jgi:hypothetical protein
MATGESMAHLNYLEAQGRARRERDADGVDWWSATRHQRGTTPKRKRPHERPHPHRAGDGVLTVTLARAEKKNAITQAMYSALAEATRRPRTTPPCGC